MLEDELKNKRSGRWIGCEVEHDYLGEDRKQGKKERKLATDKDRSKYKKTDREKFKKSAELHKNLKLSKDDLLRGRVLSITPQGFLVEHEGKLITCTLRGLLKKEKSQYKNLVTVGDFVLFEKMNEEEGLIAHIEPRHSVLSRADNLSHRKEQLIAANIDQVLITISVVNPILKPFIVDRYLIAAYKGGMEPIIVLNKVDLLQDPSVDEVVREVEEIKYRDFLKAYELAGIPVISLSTVTGEGIEALKTVMKDKASVFSGQSGVGKSSLINTLTGTNLRTGKMVLRTSKGSHTTTTASLIPLICGGWCIDTPGIKSFGVWALKKDEVESFFPEIHRVGRHCQYQNCRHLNEECCAVKEAVEKETISPMRFMSYQLLLEEATGEHLRR